MLLVVVVLLLMHLWVVIGHTGWVATVTTVVGRYSTVAHRYIGVGEQCPQSFLPFFDERTLVAQSCAEIAAVPTAAAVTVRHVIAQTHPAIETWGFVSRHVI